MFGDSLDSVPEGPGINDNGSGSSSLLEIVLQLYRSGLQPKNRVIFAWWGAEEIGLMGSYHFVQHLKKHSPEEFAKIKMALNFDMLGAPNYIPEIHNLTLPGSPAVRHPHQDAGAPYNHLD
jgi:Zn-dependent M28 family amino/carboxypeptidase